MKNTIIAYTEFDYKGETHRPSITLDLDQMMEAGNSTQSLHQVLATANNIDGYSYEYEIFMAEPILFKNADGIATKFLIGNNFNFPAFENAWHEHKLFNTLSDPLNQKLGIANIEQHPELKQIILQAFYFGRQQKN